MSNALRNGQSLNHSLSDTEIRKLTDNSTVVLYNGIGNILETLHNSPNNTLICLVRQTQTYGHWICIFLKTEGSEQGIHVYDSYGNEPDSKKWFKNINAQTLQELGEDKHQLLQLLYETTLPIYFNEYKHQSSCKTSNGEPIQTCGFHCVMRATFNDLDTNEYNQLIKKKCAELHLTPDELVASTLQAYL
jgi:hypothetical protein